MTERWNLRESYSFDRHVIAEIRRAANTGVYRIRGWGAKRRLPTLDDSSLRQALTAAGYPDADAHLTALSGGSVGTAIRLITQDGAKLYGQILALLASCPSLDRAAARAFADHITARGQDERLAVALDLLNLALSRLARHGTGLAASEAAPGEAETFTRLAPNAVAARRWATLQQDLSERIGHGRAVNVDAQSLLLDAFLKINDTAARS